MYITITSLVYHPSSNRYASLGMSSSQCSCAFYHKTYTGLLLHFSCYTSHGLTIYATFSPSTLLNFCCCAFCSIAICTTLLTSFLFTFFYSGHSLHLCPSSLYLKHSTFLISSCLLIILFSSSHCITLLLNISNLFLGTTFPFTFPPLFLQFQVRCPNPLS